MARPTEGRWAGLAAALLLAGCAAGPDPSPPVARPGTDSMIDAVVDRMSGSFIGRAQGENQPSFRLLVRPQSPPGTRPARLELIQSAVDGPGRRFMLALVASTSVPTQVSGAFSPLDAAGQPVGDCPLTGAVREQGVVLTTSAATCRFGSGAQEVGLVKEIAFDGRRLVIGDRVLRASGDEAAPDAVLEFLPVQRYAGWAGRREGGVGPWRRAAELSLAADGAIVPLNDAGGMPLGIELELAPYWATDEAGALLRLRAFDADSGELIGQVWADPGTSRIGLAVGDLQVGLERLEN